MLVASQSNALNLHPYSYPPPSTEQDIELHNVEGQHHSGQSHQLSRSSIATRHSVWLRVYDLSGGKVAKVAPFLMRRPIKGIWHTAIQAYGNEYFYSRTSTGESICKLPPDVVEKELKMAPVVVQHLGDTYITQREFECFLESIKGRFTPEEYDLVNWNCNHFTNVCSRFLLNGKEIPDEIKNLPHQVEESLVGRMAIRWLKDRNLVTVGDTTEAANQDTSHARCESSPKTTSARGLSAAPRRTATARPVGDDDISLVVHSPSRRCRDYGLSKESVRRTRDSMRVPESSPRLPSPKDQSVVSGRFGHTSITRGTMHTQRSQSPPTPSFTSSSRHRVASNMGVAHLVSIRDSELAVIEGERPTFTLSRRHQTMPRAASHLALVSAYNKSAFPRVMSCEDVPTARNPQSFRQSPQLAPDLPIYPAVSYVAPLPFRARPPQLRFNPSYSHIRSSILDANRGSHHMRSPASLMEMLRPSPLATRLIPNFATAEVLQGVSILSAFRKVA